MDRTKRIMVKALNAESYSLTQDERPVDYGHCGQIMEDKYGPERGQRNYEGLINRPGSDRGLHFVVAEKILKEKRAMMTILGKTGAIEDFSYEELYDGYQAFKKLAAR